MNETMLLLRDQPALSVATILGATYLVWNFAPALLAKAKAALAGLRPVVTPALEPEPIPEPEPDANAYAAAYRLLAPKLKASTAHAVRQEIAEALLGGGETPEPKKK